MLLSPAGSLLGDVWPRKVFLLGTHTQGLNGNDLLLRRRSAKGDVQSPVSMKQAAQRGGSPSDGGRWLVIAMQPCLKVIGVGACEQQLNSDADRHSSPRIMLNQCACTLDSVCSPLPFENFTLLFLRCGV